MVWDSKFGGTEDCWIVWVLDGQLMPTLGSVQGADFRAPHWTRQMSWVKSSQGGRDLLETASELCVDTYGGRFQGGLRDGTTLQGVRRRYLGGYPYGVAPVAEALQ